MARGLRDVVASRSLTTSMPGLGPRRERVPGLMQAAISYVSKSLATIGLAALVLAIPQAATAQGTPGVEPNKCLAGKNKCVSKLAAGLLKCRENCQKKPDKCGQVQIDCETKARDKFNGGDKPEKGCFAKLEAKENPSKPESICKTTADTAAMEAEVEAKVLQLVTLLETFDCAGAGGVEVGGACWFAGATNQSCDDACAAVGATCDLAATKDYAGSGGSTANCEAVLEALGLGFPGSGVGLGPGTGGCGLGDDTNRFRSTDPTTCEGSGAHPSTANNPRRACACE